MHFECNPQSFQQYLHLIEEIREHAESVTPDECCGFIISNKGKTSVSPQENESNEKDISFLIGSEKFLDHQNVVCIYHSHPSSSSAPSSTDKLYCNEISIPFLILSLRDDDFSLLMPE